MNQIISSIEAKFQDIYFIIKLRFYDFNSSVWDLFIHVRNVKKFSRNLRTFAKQQSTPRAATCTMHMCVSVCVCVWVCLGVCVWVGAWVLIIKMGVSGVRLKVLSVPRVHTKVLNIHCTVYTPAPRHVRMRSRIVCVYRAYYIQLMTVFRSHCWTVYKTQLV